MQRGAGAASVGVWCVADAASVAGAMARVAGEGGGRPMNTTQIEGPGRNPYPNLHPICGKIFESYTFKSSFVMRANLEAIFVHIFIHIRMRVAIQEKEKQELS